MTTHGRERRGKRLLKLGKSIRKSACRSEVQWWQQGTCPVRRLSIRFHIPGYLAAGHTAGEIMAEFPDFRKEQSAECLDYA